MPDTPYAAWTPVYSSGTDYEADLVRDRLDDAGLPAVVLTKRDHAFNLTVGNLAPVVVLVPPERAEEAVALLREAVVSEEELTEAALHADHDAPPAHDRENEARLDTGPDPVSLAVPDEEPTDEETGDGGARG
jgi:hypothetical protein